MARPQKDTVDYFPHEAIASDGTTLTILQSNFGNDGYAFWFKLLERLCCSKGHVIDCRNPARWQFLLAKTNVTHEKGTQILNLLAELDAIDQDLWEERVIWSQNLVNNVAGVYKNRRNPLPLKPHSNNQKPTTVPVSTENNTASSPVSTAQNPQTKLKYTKVYNKENYIVIWNHWNKQNIITHKKLTGDMERAIKASLRDYTAGEIEQAIDNYAEILQGDKYYFKYAWTLKDFLRRGMAKFMDIGVARKNYLKDGASGRIEVDRERVGKLPAKYTRPEELLQ